MKIWVDDVRPAPNGYVWCKSTYEALRVIRGNKSDIEMIDLDHDAGEYVYDGGDFINVLTELERIARKTNIIKGVEFYNFWHQRCKEIKFRLHSMNPVGLQNMRAIIQKNGWKEVF